MNFKSYLCGILPLMLLASCGGGYSSGGSGYTPQEQQDESGTYRTNLVAVNSSVSTASGNAEVVIDNDSFGVTVNASNAGNTTHIQRIYVGTRCPTASDDLNGDGFIDANEGMIGPRGTLITLDSNLTIASEESFPSGSSYNYSQGASYSQVLSSISASALGLNGKVVMIHGVPSSTNLPATVAGGKAAFPIACGVIQKVF